MFLLLLRYHLHLFIAPIFFYRNHPQTLAQSTLNFIYLPHLLLRLLRLFPFTVEATFGFPLSKQTQHNWQSLLGCFFFFTGFFTGNFITSTAQAFFDCTWSHVKTLSPIPIRWLAFPLSTIFAATTMTTTDQTRWRSADDPWRRATRQILIPLFFT